MKISVLAVFLSVISGAACVNYQPRAIQITEDTWEDILEGEWLVEFMAPWCPACQSFKSTWDSFAQKWSRDLEVSVGTVDVTSSPGLSGRFLITALPSIYHVKNGVFRQYRGGRQETDLITFIDDKKWNDIDPVSKWISPDSLQMGMVGLFFKFAMTIRSFYTLMTEEYGIPEWGCYVIFALLTIVTGLVMGLILVCICDFVGSNRQVPPPIPRGIMDPALDKEGDLIDDTQESDGDTKVRRRATNKDNDGEGEADDSDEEDKNTGDKDTGDGGTEEKKEK
ncbi:thioredoxin-related transmembrane protein 1-like [Mya arenaria]|uniref:thioredoxin-related transmembrane protein 1-like n=1 Tax=Mya arenaria TaxID=6604 RepID=UPI0022E394AD|nr:thioredoxin-related transmembrane protein 1-like [Mya arenaria]